MSETVIVVGAPGVGKDTVVEKGVARADREYEIVSFPDVFNEKCVERGHVKEQGDEVELEDFRDVLGAASESLGEQTVGQDTVIIHHATIQVENGFMPALTPGFLRAVDATRLVQIEADPEEVPERIEQRDRREGAVERSPRPPSVIERQQRREFQFATTAAVESATPLMTVRNDDGELDEAAETFADILTTTI